MQLSQAEFLDEASKWVLKIRQSLHKQKQLENKAQLYRAMELEDNLLQYTLTEASLPRDTPVWNDPKLLSRYREHAEQLVICIDAKEVGERFWQKVATDKITSDSILKKFFQKGSGESSSSRKKHRRSKSGVTESRDSLSQKKRRKIGHDGYVEVAVPAVSLHEEGEDAQALPPPPPSITDETLEKESASSVVGRATEKVGEILLEQPPSPSITSKTETKTLEKTLTLELEEKPATVEVQNSSAWDFFAGDGDGDGDGDSTAVDEGTSTTTSKGTENDAKGKTEPQEDTAWLMAQQAVKDKQEKARLEKEEKERERVRLENIEKAKERMEVVRKKREEEEKKRKEQELKEKVERELAEREKEREDEKNKREQEGRDVDLDGQFIEMETMESWMEGSDDDGDMDF